MGTKGETTGEVSPEQIATIRKDWRKKVSSWKKKNPNWEDDKHIQDAYAKMTKASTKKQYAAELPPFFAFIDMRPDEVITQRFDDLSSGDPETKARWENHMYRYKSHLISTHYKASTISTTLGRVAGWFSINNCSLDLPKTFWAVQASEYVQSQVKTKRYPNNKQLREIYAVADSETRCALLWGYHNGLNTGDVAKLTWKNINLNFDEININEFYYLEHMRSKTGVEHIVVCGPDLLYCLKSMWIAQGRPKDGYLFVSKTGQQLEARYLNNRFKEFAEKVIPDMETTFTDLRDCYNAVLKSVRGISQEHRDLLFGHSRGGARVSYKFDLDRVIEDYKTIYGNLTVNGDKYSLNGKVFDDIQKRLDSFEDRLKAKDDEIKKLEFQVHTRDSQMEHMREQVKAFRDEMNIYKKVILELEKKGII